MSFLTTTYNKAASYFRALWRGSYLGCGPAVRNAALNVPLIHVTKHRPDDNILFEKLLLTPPHELPVTPACVALSAEKSTQKSERIQDLGRNLYFYAGRAFPYGEVALMFDPECAVHTGSATGFDTGLFGNGKLKNSLLDNMDDTTETHTTLREFTQRNLIPLSRWRSGFRKHLAVNFSDPSHYFDGKPCTSGPAELFSRNPDNYFAWTYEVRFREGQDVLEALEWIGPSGLSIRITRARRKLPPSSTVRPRLNQFLQRAIISKGAAHRKEIIEQRARDRMGI